MKRLYLCFLMTTLTAAGCIPSKIDAHFSMEPPGNIDEQLLVMDITTLQKGDVVYFSGYQHYIQGERVGDIFWWPPLPLGHPFFVSNYVAGAVVFEGDKWNVKRLGMRFLGGSDASKHLFLIDEEYSANAIVQKDWLGRKVIVLDGVSCKGERFEGRKLSGKITLGLSLRSFSDRELDQLRRLFSELFPDKTDE